MSLLFRIAIYLPVLFLIAVVVVGQQSKTADETKKAAVERTVRWTVWTAVLLAVMLAFEVAFIGW